MEQQVQQQMQKIEGISPDMIWTALIVLVGAAALYVLFDKVREIFRKEKKNKTDREQLSGEDITDRIADKVMEKLQPKLDEKFEEIDRKLASDKQTIEMHTSQLNDHEGRVSKLEGGDKSLCQGMLALLELNPSLTKAQHAMQNYLITGKYNEEDWK